MAGDIGIREQVLVLPRRQQEALAGLSLQRSLARSGGRIMHRYGERVLLAEVPPGAEAGISFEGLAPSAGVDALEIPDDLTDTERLGLEAFALRQSPAYAGAKAARPRQGLAWDGAADAEPLVCTDVGLSADERESARAAEAGAPALSARLTGKVAVAIVIVQGPTDALKFSAAERTKVVAEVQNGLGWLGAQNAAGGVTWVYDVHNLTISETPLTGSPDSSQLEARFRDPAMAQLGYGAGLANVTKYANDLRTRLRTDWAYVAFFTKYPLGHFAYASIGGPRLVMDYANDGWGPDNIDRVFAHETGHIFGAPDEYASSGCNCGGSWGYYGKPNTNCETCAPGGGVKCLMRSNDWEMCQATAYHLGFPLAEQRYSGVFRAGTGKYALWLNASYDSFIAKWQQWASEGLRLADLDIVQVGNERRYNGVWVAGNDAYGLWVNADWNSFTAKWAEWARQGLRLVSLEVVRSGSTNLYSGVFRAGNDAYGLWANATWESFTAKWQEWSRQNLRLVDLTVTNFGNERRYSGVFRAGNDGYGLWVNTDWASFDAKWKEWSRANLRLIDLEITNFGGQRRYSGVFRGGGDAHALWVNADWSNFNAKWQEWSGQNLRLVDLEVTDPANTANAPVRAAALGLALDVEADENGGEGYGGVFGEADGAVASGGDIDVGFREPGVSYALAGSGAGEGGFGGTGGATVGHAGSSTSGAAQVAGSEADGFGGSSGGASGGPAGTAVAGAPAGDADGFGGIGGDAGGARVADADLDTGGYGGLA